MTVSNVGEISAADEFYTYEAKYINKESKVCIDADLPDITKQQIREDAEKIFKVLNCNGISRVDFFVDKKNNEIVFNEINTFPGFTSISMYPMLMNAAGYSVSKMMDKLINACMMQD